MSAYLSHTGWQYTVCTPAEAEHTSCSIHDTSHRLEATSGITPSTALQHPGPDVCWSGCLAVSLQPELAGQCTAAFPHLHQCIQKQQRAELLEAHELLQHLIAACHDTGCHCCTTLGPSSLSPMGEQQPPLGQHACCKEQRKVAAHAVSEGSCTGVEVTGAACCYQHCHQALEHLLQSTHVAFQHGSCMELHVGMHSACFMTGRSAAELQTVYSSWHVGANMRNR